jgi:hypothetical protein
MRWVVTAMRLPLGTFGSAALGFLGVLAMAQPASWAANADAPYSNVDRRNDAGNDTGDSRVEQLNSNQLNGNYKGPVELRAPNGSASAGTVQTAPPTRVR